MSRLFLMVLNMSFTASYVIICVIIFRLLLKKSPKIISYLLWIIVAFRLIVPFSFESIFSLIPKEINTAPFENNIIYQEKPQINSGISTVDIVINQYLPNQPIENSVNPLQIYEFIGILIWVTGMVILLIYSIVSIIRLKKALKEAILIEDNIYEVKGLRTPFVLGFFKPLIYLPFGLNKGEKEYIIKHEQIHIYRKDHIIKIIAFLIATIHWFNPLVWVSFKLMNNDMELSCDEKVLKISGGNIKKDYATSLLNLSSKKYGLRGSPIAFGEENVRNRVKNILNYRKSSFWVVIISVLVCVLFGTSLISNPIKNSGNSIKIVCEYMEEEYIFESSEEKVIEYAYELIHSKGEIAESYDIDRNTVKKYILEFKDSSIDNFRYYYDTLSESAFIEIDSVVYISKIDFGRFIDSLNENSNYDFKDVDKNVVKLFKDYDWTIDYKISEEKINLLDFNYLDNFEPNTYYFAYNNELSKDIGLDFSKYIGENIEIEIYYIHEAKLNMFSARGMVLKKGNQIIGAFISSGRHSFFNSWSLKGNQFEQITNQSVLEWVEIKLTKNGLEELKPEEVIEGYFEAINNKDFTEATNYISKEVLFEQLTNNMPNYKLYNERTYLPLIGNNYENFKSAKLINIELIEEEENYRYYTVTADLQYNEDLLYDSGEQVFQIRMSYESDYIGWKIEGSLYHILNSKSALSILVGKNIEEYDEPIITYSMQEKEINENIGLVAKVGTIGFEPEEINNRNLSIYNDEASKDIMFSVIPPSMEVIEYPSTLHLDKINTFSYSPFYFNTVNLKLVSNNEFYIYLYNLDNEIIANIGSVNNIIELDTKDIGNHYILIFNKDTEKNIAIDIIAN